MKNGIIITMSEEEFSAYLQTSIRTVMEAVQIRTDQEDEILKMHEVCKLLSVSKPTVYSWIEQGRLKSYKIGSRKFFLRSDIMEAIRANKLDK